MQTSVHLLLALTLTSPLAILAQSAPPPATASSTGPTYRLTYTLTDTEAGKRTGIQHVAITINPGDSSGYGNGAGHGTLKLGAKVPIVTGSYGAASSRPDLSGVQTQFTYLDTGLNIDAHLRQVSEGLLLTSKLEDSSVLPSKDPNFPQDPAIRQTVLENTALLTPGKPVVLGSLDVPGSTRHFDIEVVLEPVH